MRPFKAGDKVVILESFNVSMKGIPDYKKGDIVTLTEECKHDIETIEILKKYMICEDQKLWNVTLPGGWLANHKFNYDKFKLVNHKNHLPRWF